jgi:hypothetical protein
MEQISSQSGMARARKEHAEISGKMALTFLD